MDHHDHHSHHQGACEHHCHEDQFSSEDEDFDQEFMMELRQSLPPQIKALSQVWTDYRFQMFWPIYDILIARYTGRTDCIFACYGAPFQTTREIGKRSRENTRGVQGADTTSIWSWNFRIFDQLSQNYKPLHPDLHTLKDSFFDPKFLAAIRSPEPKDRLSILKEELPGVYRYNISKYYSIISILFKNYWR